MPSQFAHPQHRPTPGGRLVSVARLPIVVAVLAGLSVSVGCGRNPKERLTGKWIGDRIDHATADQAAQAGPWVKGTTWEFAADKVTVSLPAEPPRSGTFRVASVEGSKVTLAVTRPDGQKTDEAVLRFEGDRTMRWSIGDQREVVFVRAAD